MNQTRFGQIVNKGNYVCNRWYIFQKWRKYFNVIGCSNCFYSRIIAALGSFKMMSSNASIITGYLPQHLQIAAPWGNQHVNDVFFVNTQCNYFISICTMFSKVQVAPRHVSSHRNESRKYLQQRANLQLHWKMREVHMTHLIFSASDH